MQVTFTRTIDLACPAATAWAFVREPEQLTRCVDVLGELTAVDGGPRYRATMVDRVGPFRVTIALDATVAIDDDALTISVRASGLDRRTNTRASGSLRASVLDREGGSSIELAADMEILGALASLGSGPIRRRTEQITDAAAACLREILGP